MGKYILIFLILIIPSVVFPHVEVEEESDEMTKIGVVVNTGIILKDQNDKFGEYFSSVYVMWEMNNVTSIQHFLGYSQDLESIMMGFEIILKDKKVIEFGAFMSGYFLKYGYLFDNNISIFGSIYDETWVDDNSPIPEDDSKSWFVLETGWSFNNSIKRKDMCKFNKAWVGDCKNETDKGKDFCQEHQDLKCSSCGKKSTHTCEETGQFVCGAPLCDDCDHTTAEDGTNGNIGFYRTSPLPEGYKEHCKKSDQVYQPWYAQNKS